MFLYDDDQLFWAVDLNEAELLNEPISAAKDMKRCLWFSGGHDTDDEWHSSASEQKLDADDSSYNSSAAYKLIAKNFQLILVVFKTWSR